jgi:hypothetical protein
MQFQVSFKAFFRYKRWNHTIVRKVLLQLERDCKVEKAHINKNGMQLVGRGRKRCRSLRAQFLILIAYCHLMVYTKGSPMCGAVCI